MKNEERILELLVEVLHKVDAIEKDVSTLKIEMIQGQQKAEMHYEEFRELRKTVHVLSDAIRLSLGLRGRIERIETTLYGGPQG